MRDDARRRTQRELNDLVQLARPKSARTTHDPYLVSRGITGEPSNTQRTYGMRAHGSRAGSRTWADVSTRSNYVPPETLRQLPTVGTALSPFTGEPMLTESGGATVLVRDSDGSITVRALSDFRGRSKQPRHSRQAVAAQGTAQTYEQRVAQLGADSEQYD